MNLYIFSIILIYIFILITGFHDEGNLIATIISSKSLNSTKTFIIACLSQFAGTIIVGDKVAKTMAFQVVKDSYLMNSDIDGIIMSAMIGAIAWNIITWKFCIPSSSTHAIVGSLMGPFVIRFGFSSLNFYSIAVFILIPLFLSPLIGYKIAFWMMKFTNRVCKRFSIYINQLFKKLQILTLVFLNMEQGSNDAQKGLGLILMLMVSRYGISTVGLPFHTKLIAAIMISSGLLLGGYRMIKSVGTRIYKVKPIHSLNAQLSSSIIIFAASSMGAPISGTQIVNSATVGVGAAERPSAVGWQYVRNMCLGWLITIPCSFLFSCLIYIIFRAVCL